MKTSCFSTYKADDGVSIAIRSPQWFTGSSYPDLFPKWSFLSRYKKDKDRDPVRAEKAYIKAYDEQVLSKLDPWKVWNDLKDKTILCWERKGEFCHRRLVADWLLRTIGKVIPEF